MGIQNHSVEVHICVPDERRQSAERALRGERIRAVRSERGLSQAEFGAVLGVTKQTQIAYERGSRVPDADYLAALYFQFAVDLGPLVTGVARPKPTRNKQSLELLVTRYEALPVATRRTVDDVVLLAFLASQDRASLDRDSVVGDVGPGDVPVGK